MDFPIGPVIKKPPAHAGPRGLIQEDPTLLLLLFSH